jgi:hypothetical protein
MLDIATAFALMLPQGMSTSDTISLSPAGLAPHTGREVKITFRCREYGLESSHTPETESHSCLVASHA